jgi:DNA-binding MarR family transcriptional regulator
MNLLLKYPCVKDKRIKFYKLTEDSEQTLKEWAEANIV